MSSVKCFQAIHKFIKSPFVMDQVLPAIWKRDSVTLREIVSYESNFCDPNPRITPT